MEAENLSRPKRTLSCTVTVPDVLDIQVKATKCAVFRRSDCVTNVSNLNMAQKNKETINIEQRNRACINSNKKNNLAVFQQGRMGMNDGIIE